MNRLAATFSLLLALTLAAAPATAQTDFVRDQIQLWTQIDSILTTGVGVDTVFVPGPIVTDTVVVTDTVPCDCEGQTLVLSPGDDIQAAVDAAEEGALFVLSPGTYIGQEIVPKDGQQFVGLPGAILDGDSTAVHAFNGPASGVVIRGLVIQNYDNPAQTGAIRGNDSEGWLVEDNEVRHNHGIGIRVGDGMTVRGNYVHHQGQMGIAGIGDDVVVEDNEIAWNNYLEEYSWVWEAGGTKFVRTNRLVLRNNYVHNNHGPGLWTDIENDEVLVEDNVVEDNEAAGIFHEISYRAIIRNNEVRRNGVDQPNSYSGAAGILISASGCPQVPWPGYTERIADDSRRVCVEVYGNTVEDNGGGITAIQQPRGDGTYGTYRVTGLYVHDNVSRLDRGFTAVGRDDPNDNTLWDPENDIRYARNTYHLPTEDATRFHWITSRDFAGWQSVGNDLTGSVVVPDEDPDPDPDPPPLTLAAFPGADGWGADALSRCRTMPLQVLKVTNTNSTGAGSFDQAINDVRDDRFSVIIFDTGGRINTPSSTGTRLSSGCVYIAGQTAGGDGVVISGSGTAMWLRAGEGAIKDVVMRYLRFRGNQGSLDNGLIVSSGENLVFDHLSFSWADNYLIGLLRYWEASYSGTIRNVSIQNSLFSEIFGTHPTAVVLGSNAAGKDVPVIGMSEVTMSKNLMAHNSHRNPMTAADTAVFANNVVYNWIQGAAMMNRRGTADWINNVAIEGPMTDSRWHYFLQPYCDSMGGDFSIYAAGNISPRSQDPSGDNWTGSTRQIACYRYTGPTGEPGDEVPSAWKRTTALSVPLSIMPTTSVLGAVLADVGANARVTCDGTWVDNMDSVDARVIADVQNGTGPSASVPNEGAVGGFPTYASGSACTDTDGDGLPDAFELRYGSDTTGLDADEVTPSGYLMIEHYLNGTDPAAN